jgi:hypothetical protein
VSTQVFSLTPDNKVGNKKSFQTLMSEAESGKEQRRSKWTTPLRMFTLNFTNRPKSEVQTLEAFFDARKGAYDSFYFKNPDDNPITAEQVTGNYQQENTDNLLKFPVVSGSVTIYRNGTPLSPADYTVNVTTGQISWINKPVSGSVITADYQFYYIVRFDDDDLDIQRIAFEVYSFSLKFKEVRA